MNDSDRSLINKLNKHLAMSTRYHFATISTHSAISARGKNFKILEVHCRGLLIGQSKTRLKKLARYASEYSIQ